MNFLEWLLGDTNSTTNTSKYEALEKYKYEIIYIEYFLFIYIYIYIEESIIIRIHSLLPKILITQKILMKKIFIII